MRKAEWEYINNTITQAQTTQNPSGNTLKAENKTTLE